MAEDPDNPWQANDDEQAKNIECPHCGGEVERLEIDDSGDVTCPHCGREFEIDEAD